MNDRHNKEDDKTMASPVVNYTLLGNNDAIKNYK